MGSKSNTRAESPDLKESNNDSDKENQFKNFRGFPLNQEEFKDRRESRISKVKSLVGIKTRSINSGLVNVLLLRQKKIICEGEKTGVSAKVGKYILNHTHGEMRQCDEVFY